MSVCRKLPDGTIQKIAGHTILLDANASEIRTGTWALASRSGSEHMTTNIIFTDPMPDTDYIVVLETSNQFHWTSPGPGPIGIVNKTTTGFILDCYANATVTTFNGKYTAWKPVKIEGYTALQNKINNPDETPTKDSINLCTSGGIYEAIKNASAVWKGTKSEWTALPVADKKSYDLAVLVDAKLIKAVDRTDGSDTDVADLSKTWKGTSDGVELPVMGVCLLKTLTVGQTSVTFTHPYITTTAFIDVYSSNPDVGYTSVTTGTGTCTVTFAAQSANMQVGIKVFDREEWMI